MRSIRPQGLRRSATYAFYETALQAIVLPDTVTDVGAYAFYGCADVSEFVMSKAIESIGDYAFSGLDQITEVTIYGNNTTVGDGAFENCTSLESVTLENGVDSIGPSAFGFTAITEVTLPESVTSLEGNPFTGCELTRLDILAENADIVFDALNKTMYNRDKTLLYYVSPTFSGEYTVLDSVSAILPGAFAGSGITSITIPDTFTTIPADAFKACTQLTSFTVGKNITSIGSSAFEGCTSLATLTFETGGVNPLIIGERAFYGTSSLTEVVFPDRLRDVVKEVVVDSFEIPGFGTVEITEKTGYAGIGDSSFENSGLVTISYEKDVDIATNYDANTTVMIGKRAFANCASLVSAEFGPMTSGGSYDINGEMVVGEYAFYGCSKLSSLKLIPEEKEQEGFRNASGIDSYAFMGCDALASFSVPNNLCYFMPYSFTGSGIVEFEIPRYEDEFFGSTEVSIHDNAFEGCKKLTSFVSHAIMGSVMGDNGKPPLGRQVFKDCTALRTVVFDDVYAVMDGAFENCTALESVSLNFIDKSVWSDEVETCCMQANVFRNCSSLTSVTLTGDLKSIGANAFTGCVNLTSVALPQGVTAVAGTAFSGWTQSQTIEVPYEEGALPATFVTGWNGNAVIKYFTPGADE